MTALALVPDEPSVRPDGTCVMCGKPRRIDQARVYRQHAERDPFCSAKCCREWYGCPLEGVRDTPGSRAAAELAAARFRDAYPFREAS